MLVQSLLNDPALNQIPFAPGFDAYQRVETASECGFGEPRRVPFEARNPPRMIRSVVDEAGLGRFVYLLGESGRRYVFSRVSPDQVSLYHHALFAVCNGPNGDVRISRSVAEVIGHGGFLYVHLLDDNDRDATGTLTDLGC